MARGARAKEIADTKGGYIYDRSRQNPPNPSWGLLPRPGTAHVMVYSGCKDGRVVADVVRLAKGHTEGLEPNVTEELVRLMLSAKGGKLQQTATPTSSAVAKAMADKQATGRALAIEDYYRIKSVGDPQISQNGRWVAYTVTTRVEEDNTNAIETYVAATDGAPRREASRTRAATSHRRNGPKTACCEYTLNARVEQRRRSWVVMRRVRRPEPPARFTIAIERRMHAGTGAPPHRPA